jgi:DNA-binding HxlR family transcriptional regulator
MPAKKSGALPASRRSHCPVACALDIFGDRWTLLIIRDLLLGHSRFRDFASSPEGIPTNILSDRLRRLQARGIIRHIPPAPGAPRLAYQLTKKGAALGPILLSIRDWALEHLKEIVTVDMQAPRVGAIEPKAKPRPGRQNKSTKQ